VLVLPVLLISVDMTVLGFAVPTLTENLKPDAAELLWIVDIYSFVLAGLLVTMGTLGDRIGRRKLLMFGALGFGIASAVAAYAPSPGILIAARALLGVAGATLMPSTLSLLRNLFPDPRRRLLAIAVWAAAFSAGSALGPILGGWLLEHFWWGSVFLINLPVVVLILVLAPLLMGESRDPRPGRFDPLSVVLSMAAVLPAVYGIKQVAVHGFAVVPVVSFVVGVSLGVVFVRRQLRLPDPMIDVRLFGIRSFSVAVSTNLMIVFGLSAALFFLTQYLQLAQGVPPMQAGFLLLPGLVLSVAAHFVAVVLARRFSMRAVITGGLLVLTAGFVAMTRLPTDDGRLAVVVAFALFGSGVGVTDTLTNNAILTAAPPERAGAASAISETAYELGGALGVAVLGSLQTALYRGRLPDVPGVPRAAMAAARETLGGAAEAATHLPAAAGRALMAAARAAFTTGLHVTSAVGAVLVLAAALQAALVLREPAVVPADQTAAPDAPGGGTGEDHRAHRG
jgi:DHA2 family multidrug resistance protein-like MFS transporter